MPPKKDSKGGGKDNKGAKAGKSNSNEAEKGNLIF